MTLLTTFIALAAAITLLVYRHKSKSREDRAITSLILYFLVATGCVVMASEPLLLHWPVAIQMGACVFVGSYLAFRIFTASLWGKIVFQALFMLLLLIGGYLYSATQIPYGDTPFAALSLNQPRPLGDRDAHRLWILGLPLAGDSSEPNPGEAAASATSAAPFVEAASAPTAPLRWDDLQPLMQKDSRIREVLQHLREKQERDLSEVRAQLNATSVSSTNMRRHALERGNVEDMVTHLAQTQGNGHPQYHKRHLKALNVFLRQAYEDYRSGEFFQYALLPLLNIEPPAASHSRSPNRRANPAADAGNAKAPPPPAIVPIKISSIQGH